jgi:hypothetical protein
LPSGSLAERAEKLQEVAVFDEIRANAHWCTEPGEQWSVVSEKEESRPIGNVVGLAFCICGSRSTAHGSRRPAATSRRTGRIDASVRSRARPGDAVFSPRRVATGRSTHCSRLVKEGADDHRARASPLLQYCASCAGSCRRSGKTLYQWDRFCRRFVGRAAPQTGE